jgi:hypothetical protein
MRRQLAKNCAAVGSTQVAIRNTLGTHRIAGVAFAHSRSLLRHAFMSRSLLRIVGLF